MTRSERLADITQHPERHRHTHAELTECCMVDGAFDIGLMDAHPALGYNGGRKCDVTEGPCSCGAWH